MNGLNISVREVDGVTILDLMGKILHRNGADDLKDQVQLLIQEGKKNIILNMANVIYADSAGVEELVSSFTTVWNAGGALKLLALTSRLRACSQSF
ncbi:MAG: STAS domain-containing protein [Candidatus Zambryskibacteria bacterium]|nr:STAS domain-containing protein [Candidatus Zambryskibacteria bacterium]